jgi:DNA-binding MarR family transcriptional regulator
MHRQDLNILTAWSLGVADALAEASEQVSLPGREAAAIVLIGARPGNGVDNLCQRVGLTQSGTVRLVDRLVERGLVKRKVHGRTVALTLTARGRRMAQELTDAHEQVLASVLEPLTEDERASLNAVLRRLLTAVRRDRAEADRACRLCSWPDCADDCPVDTSVIEPADAAHP